MEKKLRETTNLCVEIMNSTRQAKGKLGHVVQISGSARVFGYTVYRGFLNRVYGILQLKYGYSVYHFL